MGKYIPKEPLLAEIESWIKSMEECFNGKFPMSQSVKETEQDKGKLVAYKSILSFIKTLEVKEVDLDFMLHEYWNLSSEITIDCLVSATMTKDEMINFAKHFFELGLCSTITEEDCKLIWNIGDEIPNMAEKDFFKELLKRYKAQKGEKI